MGNNMGELKNEAIDAAAEHIRKQRTMLMKMRLKLICAAVIIIVAFVCGTVVSCVAIRGQQYALNVQYAGLLDYLSGAEIVTEIVDGGNDGTAIKISGDNNTTSNYGG